jgi:hypothetical protein
VVETSRLTQLQPYIVEAFDVNDEDGSRDMLKVTCQRTMCGYEHWVARHWGVIREVLGRDMDPPARVVGRPCPYCSRASLIPEEFRIFPAERPRRVVKRRKRKGS